ncbi:MAG TPA: alkaline phosphatase family protein [Candidatus Acidoferrum sp.]|nr:alkaline phosphatase family protein [Candidatus Acidoferrum sp.]
MHHSRFSKAIALAAALAVCFMGGGSVSANGHNDYGETTTPIKHLVVIFQENISFDHYFATYPTATNPAHEPAFRARPGTPTVNGLSGALMTINPNFLNTAGNGTSAANPFRLDRSQAATADQGHNYTPEQTATHMGLLDLYPASTGTAGPPPNAPPSAVTTKGLNMGYYDGNTVTALWNYAQYFAINDNSYSSTFGPSTPGAVNLVAGQTNGIVMDTAGAASKETTGGGPSNTPTAKTLIGDADPIGDVCSTSSAQVEMSAQNIGDLLNAAGVTWGAFMGGFNLKTVNADGSTGCMRDSKSIYTGTSEDYIPHHAWFQYYASTANPTHARPASIAEIGHNGPANHEYDLNDFYTALNHDNLPAVSFLKAIAIQDAHAGYSDPLDEQTFIVTVVNALEKSHYWGDTAVVILYDDSDGWYDHQMSPIVNQSTSPADTLTGAGSCGNGTNTALPGADATMDPHAQGRCGYGVRQPLIVISPWARENFVDHTVTDQSSVIHFIEDNWLGGQRLQGGSFDGVANSIVQMFDFSQDRYNNDRVLFLDPTTGEPVSNNRW